MWVVTVRPAYVLAAIVALAAFLRLWRLDEVGFGNLYYAATVRSMLTSPSNFLFGAFDPGGFVTVDKPPVGFWVQAAFVVLLGWHGLALQLPQALAGTLAVPLLYVLVARTFGTAAALIAAFALAITPVSVAVDRNNTIDAQLALIVLAAAYAVLRAAERGDLRWLALAGALIGVGFNVKMSQAYLAAPAFGLAYLAAARTGVARRVVHLAVFGAVTLAVSFAWIAVADLTPRSDRPYIGSSTNDSALQLALGHNGAARLGPLALGIGGPPRPPGGQPVPAKALPPGPQPGQPGPPGQGPQNEVGENGILRLFNRQLAGQVSWTIPLALMGALVAWLREGRRWPLSDRQRDVLLWTAWLIPTALFLSFGGIIHRYYLVMLAPPVAALTGIAIAEIAALRGRARVAAAAAAIVATAAVSLNAIGAVPGAWPLLVPAVLAAAAAAVVAIAALGRTPLARPALALACAVLAVPPLLWATTPLDGGAAGLPYASPELLRSGPPPRTASAALDPLSAFLVSRRAGERFIAATGTAGTAAPIIIATGLPVMAIGGFSGGDPILDRDGFIRRVQAGEVRYVIVDDRLRRDVRDLVSGRCAPVPEAEWRQRPPAGPGQPGQPPGQAQQLYDCRTLRA
jgi:4-amino-4-deoxy-L-arabinose transferase-like glycosyltransferase